MRRKGGRKGGGRKRTELPGVFCALLLQQEVQRPVRLSFQAPHVAVSVGVVLPRHEVGRALDLLGGHLERAPAGLVVGALALERAPVKRRERLLGLGPLLEEPLTRDVERLGEGTVDAPLVRVVRSLERREFGQEERWPRQERGGDDAVSRRGGGGTRRLQATCSAADRRASVPAQRSASDEPGPR